MLRYESFVLGILASGGYSSLGAVRVRKLNAILRVRQREGSSLERILLLQVSDCVKSEGYVL